MNTSNFSYAISNKHTFLIFIFLIYVSNILPSNASILLDFNQGQQTTLSGWQWKEDVAYGNQGWILDNDPNVGLGEKYKWGDGPRVFDKGDTGPYNNAFIDVNRRAPSTLFGGSLRVVETEGIANHHVNWWVWYDGKPLSQRNITSDRTNRMSLYVKTTGVDPIQVEGGIDLNKIRFHIGTYLCWNVEGQAAYSSGDGCPYEGPGNQHYYHYFSFDSDAWVHLLVDQHPQHLRGEKYTLKNNPSYQTDGKNYFSQLNQMYMSVQTQQNETSMNIDEIRFYSTLDTRTPFQNEESITSIWVGHWPTEDEWRLGFSDMSFETYNSDSIGTYELKWSFEPITNENYETANIVNIKLFSGVGHVGEQNQTLRFRRSNRWKQTAYTSFDLPLVEEDKGKIIYFAVKDVSELGKHVGSQYPWNKGDGHNAPTELIKTIDYPYGVTQQELPEPPTTNEPTEEPDSDMCVIP
jgi:hypothetical protein